MAEESISPGSNKQETINLLKYHKCRSCGIIAEDVKLRLNPYLLEIEDRKVQVMLCQKCYDDIADDI